MMDLAILQNENNQYYLKIFSGKVTTDDTVKAPVLVSLFTDRRLTEKDPRPAHVDDEIELYLGGYWGDDYPYNTEPAQQAKPHGSLLWVLKRSKHTEETRKLAEIYCVQALAWMIENNLADTINIQAYWHKPEMLGILIDIALPDGSVWNTQFNLGVAA